MNWGSERDKVTAILYRMIKTTFQLIITAHLYTKIAQVKIKNIIFVNYDRSQWQWKILDMMTMVITTNNNDNDNSRMNNEGR